MDWIKAFKGVDINNPGTIVPLLLGAVFTIVLGWIAVTINERVKLRLARSSVRLEKLVSARDLMKSSVKPIIELVENVRVNEFANKFVKAMTVNSRASKIVKNIVVQKESLDKTISEMESLTDEVVAFVKYAKSDISDVREAVIEFDQKLLDYLNACDEVALWLHGNPESRFNVAKGLLKRGWSPKFKSKVRLYYSVILSKEFEYEFVVDTVNQILYFKQHHKKMLLILEDEIKRLSK
ncbi:MAG: hypothetical protein KF824_13460 [Fimbriimonadaceae bacterium]|nr:MAG: hypothetical protein KF824_13460 [Fimbriimonadaceae bacterium]